MASVYTINVDYFEEYCLKTAAKIFISLYPWCRYYRIVSVYIKLYYTVMMSFDTLHYFKYAIVIENFYTCILNY